MQRILFLTIAAIVLTACASRAPIDSTNTATSTPSQAAAFGVTLTAEPTPPEATATAVPTAESGMPKEWTTITFVNGKGERITVPEVGSTKKDFETSMQYIAANALWYTAGEDSNSTVMKFYEQNPELDKILAQFEGVKGYEWRTTWWGGAFPDLAFFPTRGAFFLLFEGSFGNGAILVFQRKDMSYQAIYTKMNVKNYDKLAASSPLMPTLHP